VSVPLDVRAFVWHGGDEAAAASEAATNETKSFTLRGYVYASIIRGQVYYWYSDDHDDDDYDYDDDG